MALGLLLAACGPPVRPPQPPPGPDPAALEAAGDFRGAARAWERHATALPAQRDRLLLRAAGAWWRAGEPELAKADLDGVREAALDPPLRYRYRLLAGRLALVAGDAERALGLAPRPDEAPDRELRIGALALMADIGRALDRPEIAVPALAHLAAEQAGDTALEAEADLWSMLQSLGPPARRALRLEADPVVAGWVDLAVALDTPPWEAGDRTAAIEAWREAHPAHPASAGLLQRLAVTPPAPVRADPLAILVPLSGALEQAGAAVRDGVLAARYADGDGVRQVLIFDSAETTPPAATVPGATGGGSGRGPESEGTPALPTTAVAAAGTPPAPTWAFLHRARERGAQAVIGPLEKERVAELTRSGEPPVPTLALNTAGPTPGRGNPQTLYQLALDPEDEARQAARRAVAEGHLRAIVLVPRGEWGGRILHAFSDELEGLGGLVLDQAAYAPSASDYSAPIRRLLQIDRSQARYRRLRRVLGIDIKFQPRRRQDVEFVFLAAFPRQGRLIVPQLDFFHAADLPVYATSHIYAGTPDPERDRDLAGVRFCDIPWLIAPAADETLYPRLVELWPERMKRYARLFALGIDAYRIQPYAAWMRTHGEPPWPGLTGALRMDPDGRMHRQLAWARFVRGEPQPLPLAPPIPPLPEAGPGPAWDEAMEDASAETTPGPAAGSPAGTGTPGAAGRPGTGDGTTTP